MFTSLRIFFIICLIISIFFEPYRTHLFLQKLN